MTKNKKKTKRSGPSVRKEIGADDPELKQRKPWYEKAAWPFVIVLCIVMFFMLIHGSNYNRREKALTFDEGVYIRLGYQLKNGQPYSTQNLYEERNRAQILPAYFSRPVFKHPPMYSWLVSMSYIILEEKSAYEFEELYAVASKVSNVMGCLLVLLGFMFTKKLYGYPAGLLAAFLLAIDLNVTLSSQKVWMESALSFFMFSTLYLLYKACEEHKGYFYPAGIVFGFALLTKYTAVLVAPILVTYILIYHRMFFKQKELYFFFGLAGLVILPWVVHNAKVYGLEAFKMMILGQTAGPEKMAYFAGFAAVFMLAVLAALFMTKIIRTGKDEKIEKQDDQFLLAKIAMGVTGLFIAFLFTQKPFLTSILKTLNWSEIPTAGWDMTLFKQEPRYFYLKQQIEYSPVYLFLFVGFLRAPFGEKQDVFLFLACFWILLFTTVWGNFQGRYVLSFVTPAVILISSTVILIFNLLLKQRNAAGFVGAGFAFLLMTYFILKALKVYQAIALNDNVAYF
ncbi:MAG: ArnT family glycosyltransferase [Candidatus Omnitrophota bacterium]